MKPITVNAIDVTGNRYSPPFTPRSIDADQGHIVQRESSNQPANVGSAETGDYNQQKIEEAVDKMNRQIQQLSREIQFSVDKSTDRVVIRVIDRQTNEVIRQIPSEEILNLAEHLGKFKGLLVKEKA